MSRLGALDMSEWMADLPSGSLEVPELDVSLSAHAKETEDLFSERKFNKWKGADTAEARCDFAPNKMKISNRSGVTFITLWCKSVYGKTLSEIKSEESMVGYFASNLSELISKVLGSNLRSGGYAVVTTPKRRHKERNFASLVAAVIAQALSLPFYEDCAKAKSKHRVNAVFSANNIPSEPNVIVIDDFVTTGQTLASMKTLLSNLGKNPIFFVGIFNHQWNGG